MMKLKKYIRNRPHWNKLRSVRGETLTETLVSVVIIEIVSVALVSMIRTSSHINEVSKNNDIALDETIGIATSQDERNLIVGSESTEFDVVLKVKYSLDKESAEESFKVNVYGSAVEIMGSKIATEDGGTATEDGGTATEDGGTATEDYSKIKLLQMCNYVYPATVNPATN